jgi:hypothetical protein
MGNAVLSLCLQIVSVVSDLVWRSERAGRYIGIFHTLDNHVRRVRFFVPCVSFSFYQFRDRPFLVMDFRVVC